MVDHETVQSGRYALPYSAGLVVARQIDQGLIVIDSKDLSVRPTQIGIIDIRGDRTRIAVNAERGRYLVHRIEILGIETPLIYDKIRAGKQLDQSDISALEAMCARLASKRVE